jgi:hypothetical protein
MLLVDELLVPVFIINGEVVVACGGALQVDQTRTPPTGFSVVVPCHKLISWSSLPRPLERLGRRWHVHSPPRLSLVSPGDVRPQ